MPWWWEWLLFKRNMCTSCQFFSEDRIGCSQSEDYSCIEADWERNLMRGLKCASLKELLLTLELAQLRNERDAALAKVKELEEKLAATEEKDICGLCGEPGADKIAHPEHWPGEQIPNTPYVHEECEKEECERAHAALSAKERQAFLRGMR